MSTFEPRLSTLPPEQRRLWPELGRIPRHFILYGGTALAVRMGHRQSIDFDFFSAEPFVPEVLQAILPFPMHSEVLQKAAHTLTLRTPPPGAVWLSFFGGLNIGQVDLPDQSADNGIWIAGLRDLLATKLNTVYQRAEAKDYLDIDAILRSGCTLATGLGCARAIYGPGFNTMLPLKALTYFGDGDLPTLPAEVRQRLGDAAAAVTSIPEIPLHAPRIVVPSI